MATADDKPSAEVSAWFEGLAGRRPLGEGGDTAEDRARAEGRLVRGALLDTGSSGLASATESLPPAFTASDEDWQQLLQRGLPALASNEALLAHTEEEVRASEAFRLRSATLGNSNPVSTNPSGLPASRFSSWRRPVWAVAAGVGTLALLLNQLPLGVVDPMGRGTSQLRGGSSGGAAVWRSAQPAQDAERLQEALRTAGAAVVVQTTPEGGLQLLIEATSARQDAVNVVLARLDTALGANGKLTLRVIPATSPSR